MSGHEPGAAREETVYSPVQRAGILAHRLEAIRGVKFFKGMSFTGLATKTEGSGQGLHGVL